MLVDLPMLGIIILDIVAWFFFHMTISLLLMKVPDSWYEKTQKGFTSWKWEKNGSIWQSLFRIKDWKKFLPDGTMIISEGYNKTHLPATDLESINKFIIETKRAELTHWLLIPPAFLFFIWNPIWAGLIMIVYALIANVPFIMAQRFNRPRLERLYRLTLNRQKKKKLIKN